MITDSVVQGIVSFLVRSLLYPKVYYSDPSGKEDILKEPSILVCNHTSHIDGPLVATMLRKYKIHNLAAKDRFEQKGFGFILRHSGCIPIDRKNADTSWVHQSLKVLHQDKEHIAIFPEGRHGTHRQQLPFHTGVTMLAAIAQVPVVLVYVDGPHHLLRRSKMMIAPPIRLAPPSNGLNSEYVEEQTAFLQKKMKDLMDEFIRIDGQEKS